jgi:3' exoribonuclease, RNase T-like
MDLMIDLEGLGTGPDTTILTIAAQAFDPFGNGYHDQQYYARITLESQPNRSIEQGTLDWWATQPSAAKDEAFMEEGRVPLDVALDSLGKLIWHAKRVWAQGPTYDMNILEHAYKSYGKALPWQFYSVRDSRTVFSLWPGLPKPPTSHHALEDCRRQIGMLQATLKQLDVKELR